MPASLQGQQWIRENFGRIWPAHLSAFTHLLVALRKHFDGDLDLLLVLAVIGERTRPQHWTPSLDSTQRLTADDSSGKQHPINGLSVDFHSELSRIWSEPHGLDHGGLKI